MVERGRISPVLLKKFSRNPMITPKTIFCSKFSQYSKTLNFLKNSQPWAFLPNVLKINPVFKFYEKYAKISILAIFVRNFCSLSKILSSPATPPDPRRAELQKCLRSEPKSWLLHTWSTDKIENFWKLRKIKCLKIENLSWNINLSPFSYSFP